MTKGIKDTIKILALSICITAGGCKVNDTFKPIKKEAAEVADISVLKTYLSKTLSVSEAEISYSQSNHDFTIRNKIVMKESDVRGHFDVANEYKTRNRLNN